MAGKSTETVHQHEDVQQRSITLTGAVATGTGVMIGAGIFALTGQIAELVGLLFPQIMQKEYPAPSSLCWPATC